MTLKSRVLDSKRGQVLIMAGAAMIVLLIIAALVVDLGLSWMLRRQEQNAADSGALAAARFISEPDPVTGLQSFDSTNGAAAACAYALSNGIFQTSNTTCNPAVDPNAASVQVIWPPNSSAGPKLMGDHGYVQVVISRRHENFFGVILGQPFATVTTQAIAARKK